MDHGSPRGANRVRGEVDLIDLGNEPPLSVDGGTGGPIDRRRVSVRWFSGTILTGLCGAALMGGAVFAALDREAYFASLPERAEGALRGAIGSLGDRMSAGPRKSDRLPAAAEPNVARQVIRVSTTTKVGGRELVRVRPFVRIAGNLSLSVSELSANIPAFNPQRLLADATPGGAQTSDVEAAPDAEVSFVTCELAPTPPVRGRSAPGACELGTLLPRVKPATLLTIDEVIASVRDAANWTGSAGSRMAAVNMPTGFKLAYAAEGDPDPYAGFEARIVPENVTLLPKTATQTNGGSAWNERAVTVKKGENLITILQDLGATQEDAKAVATALGGRGRDGGLKEGHKLRILVSENGQGKRVQPLRVIVAGENAIEAVVALSDAGRYVSVDTRNFGTEIAEATEDEDDDGTGVRLYQSIYETALRHQVPRPVIEDLIRVYSYDVDFQRKVQPGDAFEILLTGDDETPNSDAKPEVLFASLTVGGEIKRFYRYQTTDDGLVDYYDETGKSAKKFLVRKPLTAGLMRSGFGFRRHPILGYTKMHTGVDWSAPHGTPIYASGNGTIEKAGWESGYGKYIRIRHTNGYETAYGHMTAFARGAQVGARVRQGQIIGFVGSTGLSTGAHLHYEILVNGRFVDPMRIRLPRGRVLDGPVLATFERERDQIDSIMTRAPARVAQNTPTNGR